MHKSRLEPGLLAVFRLFTGLRLGLTLLTIVSGLLISPLPQRLDLSLAWVSAVVTTALLLYLSIPFFENHLDRIYLPIGLLVATLGPMLEQYFVLRYQVRQGFFSPQLGAWQLIPILFVPLVLIGWQYNFRMVILFCLATALLDFGLVTHAASGLQEPLNLLVGSEQTVYRVYPYLGVLFTRTVSFLMVGYMVVRLIRTQRAQQSALAQANSQLARYASTLEQLATSRERNRLARELHDTLAHSLSAVAVQLEAVKTLWDSNPDEARNLLEHSQAVTRSGLAETRRALQALRATPLDDLGLVVALRSLAESYAARAGFEIRLDLPVTEMILAPEIEQGIYRIVQEGLENASIHSQARHVDVSLQQIQDRILLVIQDDGIGFFASDVDQNRFGLQGIRERTAMLGGSLEVDSQPGKGTRLSLVI
jgi:signal transduction histidine kinase